MSRRGPSLTGMTNVRVTSLATERSRRSLQDPTLELPEPRVWVGSRFGTSVPLPYVPHRSRLSIRVGFTASSQLTPSPVKKIWSSDSYSLLSRPPRRSKRKELLATVRRTGWSSFGRVGPNFYEERHPQVKGRFAGCRYPVPTVQNCHLRGTTGVRRNVYPARTGRGRGTRDDTTQCVARDGPSVETRTRRR